MKIVKIVKIYSIFIFLFLLGFISCNQKKEQTVAINNQIHDEMVLDLVDLKTKNALGNDTVVTISNDPVYHKTKKYKAVNALELLKKHIDLNEIDVGNTKIVFECVDGYQPEMPLELFLNTTSFLAFKDWDAPKGSNWEKIVKNGNEMDAEPFYLVYTSISEKDSRYKWPYNLVKIHLKPMDDLKKKLFQKDDKTVEAGYNLFQKHCITCHSINTIGGKMGLELNYPKSVTEYWKEKELVDYIINPATFRHNVKMPAVGVSKTESEQIVDYLKYMSKNKKID